MTVHALTMPRASPGNSNADITRSIELGDATAENLFLEVPLGGHFEDDETPTANGSTARVICPNCYHNQEKCEHCSRCGRKLLGNWKADSHNNVLPERLQPKPPKRRAAPQPAVRRQDVTNDKVKTNPLNQVAGIYMILGIILGCLVSLSYALTFFFAESALVLPIDLPSDKLGLIQLHTLFCVLVLSRRGHR